MKAHLQKYFVEVTKHYRDIVTTNKFNFLTALYEGHLKEILYINTFSQLFSFHGHIVSLMFSPLSPCPCSQGLVCQGFLEPHYDHLITASPEVVDDF